MSGSFGFTPDRVARIVEGDGMGVSAGRMIASEYAMCSNCSSSLAGDIMGGSIVDRDFECTVTCSNCGTDLQVLIEEKVWGIVQTEKSPLCPVNADVFQLEPNRVLFLNPSLVYVSEEN